jgi:hypothetical protein
MGISVIRQTPMRTSVSLLLLFLIFGAAESIACSLGGAEQPFKVRAALSEESDPPPLPKAEVVLVTRGTAPPGSSCEDAGSISIRVSFPSDAQYDLASVGFRFEQVRGVAPDVIFPRGAWSAVPENGTVLFTFFWLDGAPDQQQRLDLTVAIRAVTRDGATSEPSLLHVVDPNPPSAV